MDIRLIFRNRRRTAHTEPSDAKRLKLDDVFGLIRVERATRSSTSQAMERRRKVASAWRWLSTFKHVGRAVGKSAVLIWIWCLRCDDDRICGKRVILCCREKPLASFQRPVPQTDTGGQVENTEAIG